MAINISDQLIAELQNIAYDLLNLNVNYSPLLDSNWRRGLAGGSFEKLQCAIKLVQENKNLMGFFDLFHVDMEMRADEKALLSFFSGLSELINYRRAQPGLRQEEVLLVDIPSFHSSELKHEAPENACLEKIASLFDVNKELFKVAFLNGSIGSNDYIPGWSDVDIFAMVSADALISNENFIRLKSVARQVKREIYSYHRLQVHPVFYSMETELYFRRYDRFPTVCLQRGRLLVGHDDKMILYGSETVQEEDAQKAYRNFQDDFIMLVSIKNKGVLTKILIIHRLFFFPLAYLATQGITCYKADSFDLLPEYLSGFPGIPAFCRTLKELYMSMDIKYSNCFRMRRLLMNIVDPLFINNVSLRLKSDQALSVHRLYDSISQRGLFKELEGYLSAELA